MGNPRTSRGTRQESPSIARSRSIGNPLLNQSEGKDRSHITHYFTKLASKASSHYGNTSSPSARFPPPRDKSYPAATSTPPYQHTDKYTGGQLNSISMPDYIPLEEYIPAPEDLTVQEDAINYGRRREEKERRRSTGKRRRRDSTDIPDPFQFDTPPPSNASTVRGSQAHPYVLDESPSPRPAAKRLARGTEPVSHNEAYGERHTTHESQDTSSRGQDTSRTDIHSYSYQEPHPQEQNAVPIAEGEPPLCKEQADLVELIMSGRNVFYTGSAGCGKSTVLRAFVKKLEAQGKIVQILAPTGRAALAVNGTTTWSYMGWAPQKHADPLAELLDIGKFTWKRFKNTDVIVIDEISMVENLHFERMNIVLQKARGKPGVAFGGIQMVCTGDFCQLPPVKPFQHCIHCGKELIVRKKDDEYECLKHGFYYDKDKWAFRSNAWKMCNFAMVNLTNIHRQSDKVFIDLLQKMRIGIKLSSTEISLLLNHETKDVNANAVRLFGTRRQVERLNTERFRMLKSTPRSYKCLDNCNWNPDHANLKSKVGMTDGVLDEFRKLDHRYSECAQFKKGMAVVLLANLDIKAGLVNGAQGVIQGFKPYLPEYMPKAGDGGPGRALMGDHAPYREQQIQEFIDKAECKEWPEVRFTDGMVRVIHADCAVNEYGDRSIKPYTILSRTQIPLMPGYAITTHKSQGMTLDKVVVDLSRTFEAGQAYVALSRARSLEGLKVENFPQDAQMGANPEVKEFLRNAFPNDFPPEDADEGSAYHGDWM